MNSIVAFESSSLSSAFPEGRSNLDGLNRMFVKMVESGTVLTPHTVRSLQDLDWNINGLIPYHDTHMSTPLTLVCEKRDCESMRSLLDAGAEGDKFDGIQGGGYSPFESLLIGCRGDPIDVQAVERCVFLLTTYVPRPRIRRWVVWRYGILYLKQSPYLSKVLKTARMVDDHHHLFRTPRPSA